MESETPVGNRYRRRSSIFPQYLRRKSLSTQQQQQQRKDSVFESESTIELYPFPTQEDRRPSLADFQDGRTKSTGSALKFGWINGVYIRTVLNIFGVMLFLRMGWITGNAGIVFSLAIILFSSMVTFCTALSMSAICTNGEIGTGGIYYMISRSLGAEAGSMIGIIFSFANAILVSINLVGAAETTVSILADFGFKIFDDSNDARIYATGLLILVAIIPLIGMDWEAKAMFVLLIILFLALLNYLIGTFIPPNNTQIAEGNLGWEKKIILTNLWGQWNASLPEVFSVFFPSVIGIFAGASMSGDLRDPNAAIPKGTFLAILTTSSVYGILVLFLGSTILPYASGDFTEMINLGDDPKNISCIETGCKFGLINDYQTMALGSLFGPLIYAGIYAATISSALGSYVCSPRIFQALCEDKLIPYIGYFSKGYGKNNDPRRGYLLTFIIALLFTMIGDVNAIAPIISNFFMASFCLVNVACFHASFVGSPSFRPTFKYYNKWISFVTGIVCVVIMFCLDWRSAVITVLFMGLIFLYVSKHHPDVDWGTSTKGHVYNNAVFSALKLNQTKEHVKDFRPSILLLTGNPSARIPLVEFTNHITKNRSLLMIGHIVPHEIDYDVREKVLDRQYEWMAKRKIKGFYLLLQASSLATGVKNMFQIAGLGRKLSPNILMMGYKSSWRDCLVVDLIDYYNVLIAASEWSIGICVLRIQEGLDYADFIINNSMMTPSSYNNNNNGEVLGQIPEIPDNESIRESVEPKPILVENVKQLIPNDAMEAMNQFNETKTGNIDIWWLAEDGGLTIMIPYLLNTSHIWTDCTIRLFCMADSSETIQSRKQKMVDILKKLRIPYKNVTAICVADTIPSERSKESFKSYIHEFMAKGNPLASDYPARITQAQLNKFERQTWTYLALRDLLVLHSKESTLVVMTLPLFHREIPPSLYMAWLETLSVDMPPFLFVRGHKSVISI